MTEEIEGANSSTSQCVPVVAERQNEKVKIIGKASQKLYKTVSVNFRGVAFT
jgi:hypothetical protein